jgi:hypothetical protein
MTPLDQEAAVLSALRETQGYFTLFWATQTQYRALALERIEIAYRQPRLFDEPRSIAIPQELGL